MLRAISAVEFAAMSKPMGASILLKQNTYKHLLRRHGQVSVKVFDELAK